MFYKREIFIILKNLIILRILHWVMLTIRKFLLIFKILKLIYNKLVVAVVAIVVGVVVVVIIVVVVVVVTFNQIK